MQRAVTRAVKGALAAGVRALMATISELLAWRDRLSESRYTRIREVLVSNRKAISYKSGSEVARAIAALDAEIAKLSRGTASRIIPRTSKGE